MTTNYAIGHRAEQTAAEYLIRRKYKIMEINWKTKYCEIDVVAQKNKTVFFTEVKYRKSIAAGSGFEYITSKKLSKMKFAAEMWVAQNKWTGDYQLAAIEMSGEPPEVTQFLTEL